MKPLWGGLLAGCFAFPLMVPVAFGASELHFNRAVQLEATSETSANASLGDLDGDGDLDIILAKGRHWPLVDVVLLNDGKGGFDRRHDLSNYADRTYTAALADLDLDGDLDLVVGNDRPDEKLIYHNDGAGQFHRAGQFGEAPWPTRNITVTDLDGDRHPDVVVANRGERAPNYFCMNNGQGLFKTCRVLSSESATTIAAGDLTGNGVPDLVVPHRDGGQSYIFVNDGKGGFGRKLGLGPARSATRAIALGDLSGDGRLDILLGNEADGGAYFYVNREGLDLKDSLPLGETKDVVYSIAVADLDGDGDADVVLGNRQAPGTVLLNDGSGRAFSVVPFGDGKGTMYGLAIGDVDGDGRPDIVAARSGAPNMLYINSSP